MADRPESRRTHITRILGVDRKGNRLDDVYADMERIDVIKSRDTGQGIQRKLQWCDDPDSDNYFRDGTPSRITDTIKLCDVESEKDVNDPDEWIPISAIKGVKSSGGSGQGDRFMDRFLEAATGDDASTSRIFEVRRTIHYDTNIDDAAQAAFDADPERIHYVVTSENYKRDEDDPEARDKGQYLEHEILQYVKSNGNTLETSGADFQTKLLNQYLIDQSENATQEIVGANGINPPYRLDPFQSIINVSWGGLAVEFPDNSYAEISTVVPNAKKATIALWFRVPSASIAAAAAEIAAWKAADDPGPRPPLCGVVPIVTLGAAGKVEKYDTEQLHTGDFPGGCAMHCNDGTWEVTMFGGTSSCNNLDGPLPQFALEWVLNGQFDACDPSYIGVDCSGDYPMLSVNLITPYDNKATMAGSFPIITSQEWTGDFNNYGSGFGTPPCGEDVTGPNGPCVARFTWNTQTDVSDKSGAQVLLGRRNETFRLLPQQRIGESLQGDAAPDDYAGIRIVPDHWHQVIVSFDLTTACVTKGQNIDINDTVEDTRLTAGSRTTSAPRIFVAMDDVNYTGAALSAYYPRGYSDRNAVCSVNGYFICCDVTHTGTQDVTGDNPCQGGVNEITITEQLPTYSFTPSSLALSAGSMAFPAASEFVDAVKHVELADPRMFLNVAVDTGDIAIRRLFIDKDGKPVPIGDAEEALGKDAEVLLRPARNLKKGRNVGSLANTPPDDGTVVGKVETYRPGPSLHGKQG